MSRHVDLTCSSRPPPQAQHTFTSLDMDYLRTLGTAAVSSIVQKSGLNLPFTLGVKFPPLDALNIWTLYDATKRVYTSRSTLATVLIPVRTMQVLYLFLSSTASKGVIYSPLPKMRSADCASRDTLTYSNSWT